MPPGTGDPSSAPLPTLPGSPVASLAEAGTRDGVTAPPNALGAEELASVPEGACGAGTVAAAETKRGGVRVPGPMPGPVLGPVAASCTPGGSRGGTWVPSSRARSAGTTRSPHRRRPRAGSGGKAGGRPRRGSRGRSAPCTGSRSSRAGTPGRSHPRASRAGCACSSRSCTGTGVARLRHPPRPPKKCCIQPGLPKPPPPQYISPSSQRDGCTPLIFPPAHLCTHCDPYFPAGQGSRQLLPWYPGTQLQCPLRGLQEPCKQSQRRWHAGPQNPALHSHLPVSWVQGERLQEHLKLHLLPHQPGRQRQCPVRGSQCEPAALHWHCFLQLGDHQPGSQRQAPVRGSQRPWGPHWQGNWHSSPQRSGWQVQRPLSASHVPPGWHGHRCLQSGPQYCAGQPAGGKR